MFSTQLLILNYLLINMCIRVFKARLFLQDITFKDLSVINFIRNVIPSSARFTQNCRTRLHIDKLYAGSQDLENYSRKTVNARFGITVVSGFYLTTPLTHCNRDPTAGLLVFFSR